MIEAKWAALALIPVVVVTIVVMGWILLYFFRQPTMQEMVPPTLAAFFDTFDQNHDNLADISEGNAFFNWCEANVQYRYDDEQQTNPVPGVPVGDGRTGPEYWQKPIETYEELMGDCEDMAILSTAFYRHLNVLAYVATVNAEGEQADHAVCIVKIGDTQQEAQQAADYLGGIVYYQLQDGYFMLIDSAYSDQLGLAGSGPGETVHLLEEGRFKIQDLLTLEEAYKRSGG